MQLDSIKLVNKMKNARSMGPFFWQPPQPAWLLCVVDPFHHTQGVADGTKKE